MAGAAPRKPARARKAPPRGPARTVGPATGKVSGGAVSTAGPAIKLAYAKAANDPRVKAVMAKVQRGAARTKQHLPAATKAGQAQSAALPPANEKLAGAKASQVGAMNAAQTGKPDQASFLTMLRAAIEKVIPKKTSGAKDFMKGEDKQQLKGAMTDNIGAQKAEATAGVQSASEQAPDPSRVPGKVVTPIPAEPAPVAPPVGAADAMPAPKKESDVSLDKGVKATDKAIKDAELTDDQLKEANDSRFSRVITAKQQVDTQSKALPERFRTKEKSVLGAAAAKATGDERKGLAGAVTSKKRSDLVIKARQLTAKEKDELRRKEVAKTIEGIYGATKEAVDRKLTSLETDVGKEFDAGTEAALVKMRDYVDERFDDRYSGIRGKARWLKDKFIPLPKSVKAWFDESRTVFTAELDKLVVRVANLVETRLKEAKALIAKGERDIAAYVASLPEDLKAVGREAQKEMAERFEDMRRDVDDKKQDLASNIAQRYKDATEKGEAALKEMVDAHKSLVEKAIEFVGEVVEVLRNFKNRLLGILKKGKDAIGLIVAHPVRFLGNLLSAVKLGLKQFVDRIWDHLKEGFLKWLFGSLADSGITMPKDLSLPSILMLVLQVLGLTYDRLRAKAVRLVGERNVALVERVVGFVKTLWDGGPAALWAEMQEFLSDLKQQVIDTLQNWVITTVIKAAVTKLATMFNPVGAIIQAILTIYNTVMFFIENINRILDFVEAVVSSFYKIATGAIGEAANWIEKALANTIPIIIAFLARLLGISGVTDKIVGTIKRVQSRVDRAVDKVLAKVVGGVGKLVGAGKAAVGAVLEWWKTKVPFTDKKGRPHKLFFAGEGAAARLKVASAEMFTEDFVARVEKVFETDAVAKSFARTNLVYAKQLKEAVDKLKVQLEREKKSGSPSAQFTEKKLKSTMMELGATIGPLIDILPENQVLDLPVKPGAFVTLPYKGAERKAEILFASKERVNYEVRSLSAKLNLPTAVFKKKWEANEIRPYIEEGAREKYLGATPGKASATGKVVVARYRTSLDAKQKVIVEWKPGRWWPIDDCDMSHDPVDAVDFWNNTARPRGWPPKGPDVRAWMLDPKNYILEPAPINRGRGSRDNQRYLAP